MLLLSFSANAVFDRSADKPTSRKGLCEMIFSWYSVLKASFSDIAM